MDPNTLAQKQAQFHAFFTIEHPIGVNMKPVDATAVPSEATLTDHMPYAFRISAEMNALETQALRPLRNLGEHASELVAFLNHQSRKIDLMMTYILQQQDEHEYRHRAVAFGGGGVIIETQHPVEVGQWAELKLFLTEEAAAVFAYGEVIACVEAQDKYHISLIFGRIREEDQELLVRASLHLQTQQLRARSKQQQHDSE
ncbi:PilZ domain-containing protein [Aestuariibacter halophilus]|uniref:PilZ domain-containing protein n=1 Tax=Fluctibacter halophilus TaxID=226011 RepID=A0ABS8G731_9ALTE|nr:PilZ domain-containing protein [Aestuariibacter halophilus]MCC2615876.1 PilZ domain-containing protein [Aestuariibacter halophilus]